MFLIPSYYFTITSVLHRPAFSNQCFVLLFTMLRTHPSVARLLLAHNLKYIHVLVGCVGDVSNQEPSM